jgi:hypothetical protein
MAGAMADRAQVCPRHGGVRQRRVRSWQMCRVVWAWCIGSITSNSYCTVRAGCWQAEYYDGSALARRSNTVSPQARIETELLKCAALFRLGEHRHPEYTVSATVTVLAAVAAVTKRIRLTRASTLLSTADPVRTFEEFATVDLIAGGRAEIIVGRGAFIEGFALFGYDLKDYDALHAARAEFLPAYAAYLNQTMLRHRRQGSVVGRD